MRKVNTMPSRKLQRRKAVTQSKCKHKPNEHISTNASSYLNLFTAAKFHARKTVTPKVSPTGRFQAALEKQVCEGLVLALGFLPFSANVFTVFDPPSSPDNGSTITRRRTPG